MDADEHDQHDAGNGSAEPFPASYRCDFCGREAPLVYSTSEADDAPTICGRCLPACNGHQEHVVKLASQIVHFLHPKLRGRPWADHIVKSFLGFYGGSRTDLLEAFEILRDALPGDEANKMTLEGEADRGDQVDDDAVPGDQVTSAMIVPGQQPARRLPLDEPCKHERFSLWAQMLVKDSFELSPYGKYVQTHRQVKDCDYHKATLTCDDCHATMTFKHVTGRIATTAEGVCAGCQAIARVRKVIINPVLGIKAELCPACIAKLAQQ